MERQPASGDVELATADRYGDIDLAKMNVPQQRYENYQYLTKMGGFESIQTFIGTNVEKGLSSLEVESNRDRWGNNSMPTTPLKSFFELFFETFKDSTVIILLICAIISLVLGVIPEISDEENGWIEGAAILVAVFLVALVTAVNDYSKQLMFLDLERKSSAQEQCHVLRDGEDRMVNPDQLVVGDVIILFNGDKIFADSILFKSDEVKGVDCKEDALTGEPNEIKKYPVTLKSSPDGGALDPFMLSSTLCLSTGDKAFVKGLVIGVGTKSQWGRIKTELTEVSTPTPLQEKLNRMVDLIGYFGTAVAILVFAILFIAMLTYEKDATTSIGMGSLDALIAAIVIVVVAIPEGLPLAVTISLAYSTGKMLKQNNLIRVLQACETMGNATNICSDKTGTLTEGRMTVVQGFYGNHRVDQDMHQSHGFRESDAPWKTFVFDNIANNSQGQVVYGYENLERTPFSDRRELKLPWLIDDLKVLSPVPREWRLLEPGMGYVEQDKYSVRSPPTVQEKLDRPAPSGGNVTEAAVLAFAHTHMCDTVHEVGDKAGAAKYIPRRNDDDRVWVFPFDSKIKRSSCIIRLDASKDQYRVLTKGAAEQVLGNCSKFLDVDGSEKELTPQKRSEIESFIDEMARDALRCIILAHRDVSGLSTNASNSHLEEIRNSNLTCDAVLAIIDPLREGVQHAVQVATQAGIKVRMVTGDNVVTATAIAKAAGIYKGDDVALSGPDFRRMTPKEVDAWLPHGTVLGRASPEDKLLLVSRLNGATLPKNKEEWEAYHELKDTRVLQGERAGQPVSWELDRDSVLPGYREEWEASRDASGAAVVGVTGDGTNDAPALKVADVGLAMGSGTDVAKGASDIVILDDKFTSIINAIKWGRCVYDNICKFLQFQLTVNVVALTIVFLGAVIPGHSSPLNAIQMLWVNLIMDTMGALALGTEQPTDQMLERKPYLREVSLVSKPMARNILVQSVWQITFLLVLMLAGKSLFGLDGEVNGCKEYKVYPHGPNHWWWDQNGNKNKNSGLAGCPTFKNGLLKNGTYVAALDCGNPGSENCYDSNYDSFDKVNGATFEELCLLCVEVDHYLYTMVFTAFVLCTVCNEFNARSIRSDWNVFKGLSTNPMFLGIIAFTLFLQVLLVQFAGEWAETTPLSASHWAILSAFSALTIPVGIAMRFIPPTEEDPETFVHHLN